MLYLVVDVASDKVDIVEQSVEVDESGEFDHDV